MTDFPSGIQPQVRTFNLGEVPTVANDTIVGKTGTAPTDHTVTFSFLDVGEPTVTAVYNHHLVHRESIGFGTPADLWRMQADQYEVVPPTHEYKYTEPPTFTPKGAGFYDMEITLTSCFK